MGTPQFLPLFDRVAGDDSYIHLARERAAELAEAVRAWSKWTEAGSMSGPPSLVAADWAPACHGSVRQERRSLRNRSGSSSPASSPATAAGPPSDAEQSELMHAVNEGANSTLDLVRVFEAFLKKYPNTNYRPDIERNLTKASIENQDDARIVRYGELVLAHTPDDVVTLDAVAQALVATGRKRQRRKGAEVRAHV